jgi:hypothetical protein
MNASLRRARRLANCRCYRSGARRTPSPDMLGPLIIDWTCRNEYWNPPETGHLIAASLAMDGQPSRGPYLSPPCRPVRCDGGPIQCKRDVCICRQL